MAAAIARRATRRCSALTCIALTCSVVTGCHAAAVASGADATARNALRGIAGTRFVWVEAECSDGPLDLGRLGFDRSLLLELDHATLQLTFDTELATEGCTQTAVWHAHPGSRPELWRFEPQAIVTLPAGAECGAFERDPAEGSLRLFGDVLELSMRSSPWCRGFDARFVYRRAGEQRLSPTQVVMRYTAAWNRRDADAVASLFVDSGSLVEPFTRTDDGNYARHEGRAALRAWYASAFAGTPWLAMRLLAVEPGGRPDQFIASWEYMDPHLAQPLHGRTLFVIAGGEIYESEIQLLDDPKEKSMAERSIAKPSAESRKGSP